MIQYEPLSPKHRREIVVSIRVLAVVLALALVGLHFFLPSETPESGRMGGLLMFLFQFLEKFNWLPEGWFARDMGYLFLKCITMGITLWIAYGLTCFTLDLWYNQQAFIEGTLQKKRIRVRSESSNGGGSDFDQYALSVVDTEGVIWDKKIPEAYFHNLLEGDAIKFIFAPNSGIALNVEVLSRKQQVEDAIQLTTQKADRQALTKEDIAFANHGNGIYYLLFGLLIFMLFVINFVLYHAPYEVKHHPVVLLFVAVNLWITYALFDTFKRRYNLYKDIKSGYKLVRLATVISKSTKPQNGRDACIVTLQCPDLPKLLSLHIESTEFERIVPNDIIVVTHLERSLVVFGVV